LPFGSRFRKLACWGFGRFALWRMAFFWLAGCGGSTSRVCGLSVGSLDCRLPKSSLVVA
jgi:hypothetical protein